MIFVWIYMLCVICPLLKRSGNSGSHLLVGRSVCFYPFAWELPGLVQWLSLDSTYVAGLSWFSGHVVKCQRQTAALCLRVTKLRTVIARLKKMYPIGFQVTWSKVIVKLLVFISVMQYLQIFKMVLYFTITSSRSDFLRPLISSPEPKAQVSFSAQNLSVVRHRCRCCCRCRKFFTFSSSSPEPQGQFQPKAQSILGWRGFKFIQMKGRFFPNFVFNGFTISNK